MQAIVFNTDFYGSMVYIINTDEKIFAYREDDWEKDSYSVVRVKAKDTSARPGESISNVPLTIIANGTKKDCESIVEAIVQSLGAIKVCF